MVGLENRAGRCALCRRKKIKCDLVRPACTRCSHLRLTCEYPKSQMSKIFINRTVEKPFIKAPDVLSKPSDKIQYLTQALSTFLSLYLPEEARGRTKPYQTPASWVHVLASLPLENPVYNKSLAALCVAQIGRCNHDVALFRESIGLYTSALGELRRTIQRGRPKSPEATLASIVILSIYETFSSSSEGNRGWVSHVHGGGRMIHLLGQRIYDSEICRQFFERIRTICILEALRTRKASVLERQQWQSAGASPQNPNLFRNIQDLMIQLPPIMEAFDSRATSMNSGTAKTANELSLARWLQSCFNLSADLSSWYKLLNTQIPGMLYWTVPCMTQSPADNAIQGPVFPLAFVFANLSVAQLLLLYWSTLILLRRIIQEILQELNQSAIEESNMQDILGNLEITDNYEPCPDHKFVTGPLSYPFSSLQFYPSDNDIALLANNICQSIEYCYLKRSGTLGVQSTIFPLWVAQDFYASRPDRGRELSWCSEVRNMIGPNSRYDVEVMTFGKSN